MAAIHQESGAVVQIETDIAEGDEHIQTDKFLDKRIVDMLDDRLGFGKPIATGNQLGHGA